MDDIFQILFSWNKVVILVDFFAIGSIYGLPLHMQ